jgi:hypothetical protein
MLKMNGEAVKTDERLTKKKMTLEGMKLIHMQRTKPRERERKRVFVGIGDYGFSKHEKSLAPY